MAAFALVIPVFGQSKARPNYLLIIADECTYRDLGVYGGQAKTPHLDKLASACSVRWPGKVKAGFASDALIEYVDVVPTFLEAAGVGRPYPGKPGRSGILFALTAPLTATWQCCLTARISASARRAIPRARSITPNPMVF